MLVKGFISLLVFIVAALVVGIAGNLLAAFPYQAMQIVGRFFEEDSIIIGVIAAIGYFIWGYLPTVRRP